MRSFVILPVVQVFLAFVAFVLHVLVLPSRYWGVYRNSNEGLPQEFGYYGFWSLCSIRAPYSQLDCEPQDTLFRPPPLMGTAGIVAIVHAVSLGLFFPLALLRVRQLGHHKPDLILSAATVGVLKISLAIISTVLGALVLTLVTIKESLAESTVLYRLNAYKNFSLQKGWAFWMEVAIVTLDLIILVLCATENIQLSKIDTLLKLTDYNSSDGRASPRFSQLSTPTSTSRLTVGTFVNPSLLSVRNGNNNDNSCCHCSCSMATVSDGMNKYVESRRVLTARATLAKRADSDKCTSPNCQLNVNRCESSRSAIERRPQSAVTFYSNPLFNQSATASASLPATKYNRRRY